MTKGFKKTTTREIAEKASVNLGLIPYYFQKKENLARHVYQQIMRDIINLEDLKHIPARNSIQQFFLYYAMVQHNMLREQGVFSFYIELIYEDVVAVEPQPYTYRLVKEVVAEYGLDVDADELELYVQIMKGVERTLTVRKVQGKTELSYVRINRLLVLNLLLMLGLDKKTIQGEINQAEQVLATIGLDEALMQ